MSLSDTTEPVSPVASAGPLMPEGRRGPSPMMFLSLGIGTLVAVTLIVVVSLLTGGKQDEGLFTSNTLNGTTAASFTLPDLSSSGTLRSPWSSGHPTVLVFYASWCPPCHAELPKVADYDAHHHSSSVQFFGMDANDTRAEGLAFATSSHVAFPSAFDANGTITNQEFKFANLPDTVFVNGRGVITEVVIGAVSTKQLDAGIRLIQS